MSEKNSDTKDNEDNEELFVIDGNEITEFELDEFAITYEDFYINLELNCDFLDEEEVPHHVSWIHPNIQRILDTYKGDKELKR